jgi:hypothetical protein
MQSTSESESASPNFIIKRVRDLREVAQALPTGTLRTLLNSGADLIERQRESASAVRTEHERLTTELQARIYTLECEVAALRFPEGKAS